MKHLDVSVASYDTYDASVNRSIAKHLVGKSFNHLASGEIRHIITTSPTAKEQFQAINILLQKNEYHVLHTMHKLSLDQNLTILCEKKCNLYYITFAKQIISYEIYCQALDDIYEFITLFENSFQNNNSKLSVKFAFWQQDQDQICEVNFTNKNCPTLNEIRDNYSPSVYQKINLMANLENPHQHGKIILFHGPAGNGKTWLIRALARYWHEKYKIIPEVIIDPELLYENSKYLTSLLLRSDEVFTKSEEPPFRFIIAEDCAQLFSNDCRNNVGFSRLLNTADGLLGQDKNLIFLFTANEQIDEIDKAILRPGRCIQNIEIPNWTRNHATNWLKLHNAENKINQLSGSETNLAELYALLNNKQIADNQQKVFGF